MQHSCTGNRLLCFEERTFSPRERVPRISSVCPICTDASQEVESFAKHKFCACLTLSDSSRTCIILYFSEAFPLNRHLPTDTRRIECLIFSFQCDIVRVLQAMPGQSCNHLCTQRQTYRTVFTCTGLDNNTGRAHKEKNLAKWGCSCWARHEP